MVKMKCPTHRIELKQYGESAIRDFYMCPVCSYRTFVNKVKYLK